MFDYLAAVSGGGRSAGKTVPNEHHIEALIHVLDRWPAINRFPRTLLDLPASLSGNISTLSLSSDRPCQADRRFCTTITARGRRTWGSVHGRSSESIRLGRALDPTYDESEGEEYSAAS